MTVSATVEESCHIDARPLVFGTLRGDQGRVEAQSTLLLACTPATGYAIGIDDGRNAANGIRRMADATGMNFLAYELFSDSARHRRWTGDGTVSAVAPANGHVELTVYAHVETGRAAAGTYGDVLTITVSF